MVQASFASPLNVFRICRKNRQCSRRRMMSRAVNANPVKLCRFTQSNRVMPGYVTLLLPYPPPDGRTR